MIKKDCVNRRLARVPAVPVTVEPARPETVWSEAVEEYYPAFIVLAGVVLGIVGLYGVALVLAPTRRLLRADPYLSGDVPREHAFSRFHIRWYGVTLVFLVFDMEMVFMYPWAVMFLEVGLKAFVEGSIFLGLLTLGVVYAWREGGLRWV